MVIQYTRDSAGYGSRRYCGRFSSNVSMWITQELFIGLFAGMLTGWFLASLIDGKYRKTMLALTILLQSHYLPVTRFGWRRGSYGSVYRVERYHQVMVLVRSGSRQQPPRSAI